MVLWAGFHPFSLDSFFSRWEEGPNMQASQPEKGGKGGKRGEEWMDGWRNRWMQSPAKQVKGYGWQKRRQKEPQAQ